MNAKELGFSVRGAWRAIGVPYNAVCRVFAKFLTHMSGRKSPAFHETRYVELIVWLFDWMARVVYCSISPSTFRRRLLELNFRSVKRTNPVELTDGSTTVIGVGATPFRPAVVAYVRKALTLLYSFYFRKAMAFHSFHRLPSHYIDKGWSVRT